MVTINYQVLLRTFNGLQTAALTFRTKQYSTSHSSNICYGKRFYNDFFLNHNTIALVHNCLKLLSCMVNETALDGMKINQLFNSLLSTRNVPFNIKSYRFECNGCNPCSIMTHHLTIMTHPFAFGCSSKG